MPGAYDGPGSKKPIDYGWKPYTETTTPGRSNYKYFRDSKAYNDKRILSGQRMQWEYVDSLQDEWLAEQYGYDEDYTGSSGPASSGSSGTASSGSSNTTGNKNNTGRYDLIATGPNGDRGETRVLRRSLLGMGTPDDLENARKRRKSLLGE